MFCMMLHMKIKFHVINILSLCDDFKSFQLDAYEVMVYLLRLLRLLQKRCISFDISILLQQIELEAVTINVEFLTVEGLGEETITVLIEQNEDMKALKVPMTIVNQVLDAMSKDEIV